MRCKWYSLVAWMKDEKHSTMPDMETMAQTVCKVHYRVKVMKIKETIMNK